MVHLGEIYILGNLKENAKYEPENLLDNPFGEGKIYKSNLSGKWSFDGKLEIIKDTNKKDTSKSSNLSLSQSYSFLKTYDYAKVNSVLSRNTYDNFKTISKIEPRRYFTYTAELDTWAHILHMNF